MGNIENRILKKIRLVHSIAAGDITFEYLINRIMEVHSHPNFDLSFNIFADYENAVLSFRDKDFDLFNVFSQEMQKSKIHRKWAVYTKNEITFQTANMNQILFSDVINVDVFQDRNMALAFLGITDEDLVDY